MILSIGMIVKNEEKYLRRCLEGLKPILDSIDSELIIADTGSTDNTVDIAKEFTNKVFHFEWCNDFAAARNSTYNKAKGEWFMFIDADEIINDASELIAFFKSGEYKRYDSATYIQRNYNSEFLGSYNDFNAPRMIKRTANGGFVGMIHEGLKGFGNNVKCLQTAAHHYGYMNIPELAIKKFERNKALLLNKLENGEEKANTCMQLAQTYLSVDKYADAEKYALMGIDFIDEKNIKETDEFILLSLYLQAAQIYKTMCRYDKVVEMVKKYLIKKKQRLSSDTDAYGFLTVGKLQLKKFDECVSAYNSYKAAYKAYNTGKTKTADVLFRVVYCAGKDYFCEISCCAAYAYAKLDDYVNAKKTLDSINYIEFTGKERKIDELMNNGLKVMSEISDYSIAADIINNGKERMPYVIKTVIMDNFFEYKGIAEALCGKIKDEKYALMLCIRDKDMRGEDVMADLEKLVDDFEYSDIYKNIFYYMLKYKISPDKLSKLHNIYSIAEYISAMTDNDKKNIEILEDYICAHSETESITAAALVFLLYTVLLKNAKNLDKENALKYYEEFAEFAGEYMSLVYNPQMLNDDCIAVYPNNVRFAYHSNIMFRLYNDGKISDAVKYLRLAIKADNSMDGVVSLMSERINRKVENEENRQNEFDEYAQKVKAAIMGLLNSGDAVNARKFLESYKKVNAADTDIVHLEKRLNILENNK